MLSTHAFLLDHDLFLYYGSYLRYIRRAPDTKAARMLLVYFAAFNRCTFSLESLYRLKHCNKRHQGGKEANIGDIQYCDTLHVSSRLDQCSE